MKAENLEGDARISVLLQNAAGPEEEEKLLGAYLLHCILNNDAAYARELLDKGIASIDFRDDETGLTPIHVAVGTDNMTLAALLVERGVKFVPDRKGRMPTTVAAECEVSDEMCDFIVEAEAKAEGV
jgi:ankyrin repeat protein